MQTTEFIQLLQQPATITADQTTALENIIQEAPYFQAARAIRLKGLKEHQEFSYNSALKKTAAYTTNRSVLFDFITSKEFNQNKIARQIQDQEEQLQSLPRVVRNVLPFPQPLRMCLFQTFADCR